MAAAAARRPATISSRQAIDLLLDLIASFPEQVENMPAKVHTRAYWLRILAPDAYRGPSTMAMLRELPAFTNLGPKGRGRAAWKRVFKDGTGLDQVREFVRHLMAVADTRQPERPPVVSWRDAYGPDEQVQRIRPLEHHDYIHNPHRGTTTFQRFQGDPTYPTQGWSDTHGPTVFPRAGGVVRDNEKYIPRTTLTYCRWPWKWLEPRKGQYDWSIIDGALRTAAARGQTAQLRFQPYTMRWDTAKNPPRAKRYPPELSVNVPDWYWDTGARWIAAGPYCRNEPDSNDPRYLKHFGDFIRAFARRYDGHPVLESIDMAYAGFWGESGGNSTPATAAKLADIYLAGFKRTQLVGMLGTPAIPRALARGCRLGWRADCFGDLKESHVKEVPRHAAWNHTYDNYVGSIHRLGLQDAWKTAPVTMETCSTVEVWSVCNYDLDRIIEEGYRYHTSVFMPKSVFFPEKALEKLIAFDRRIGYRFALRQLTLPLAVKRGGQIAVSCFADNVGCAPLYRPYALALRFTQGRTVRVVRFAVDLRTWLPGHAYFDESIRLPAVFQRGEVKIALGIVDEHDTPRVWWAITGATDGGWHPLTSINAT
jgi:hypothetical protein